MNKAKGFTLIELVVVIVVVGILSVTALPKFINLQDDAHAAVVSGTGGAFKEAISLAHTKWVAGGHSGPVDNLDLYGTGSNLMDMNRFGWPAQSWFPFESDPQLNNTNDCISVWGAVLDNNSPTVATNAQQDFQVTYSSNTCTYTYVDQPAYSIFYDSVNGEVVVDTEL
ncbi:prepilin-type N-terminal cleavage/methylation domain-containing protein [Thalassotalea agarivorans]|uniref:Prepilin-type N-terminal cleavage/methylation domain-containing protein n=1 Tax=Thalassotalea agarivorans TaxID=349064 RepID=A0A1H9ZMJ7_THASX|nr:prepilin-type N-terminal cleavage/methylation domain-containing protein [Thalassotalea agarivorans]SES82872.1 prepilin-type N-terminal cleavage/methylation domain-containing protein [Thalassotalea agarivorans]